MSTSKFGGRRNDFKRGAKRPSSPPLTMPEGVNEVDIDIIDLKNKNDNCVVSINALFNKNDTVSEESNIYASYKLSLTYKCPNKDDKRKRLYTCNYTKTDGKYEHVLNPEFVDKNKWSYPIHDCKDISFMHYPFRLARMTRYKNNGIMLKFNTKTWEIVSKGDNDAIAALSCNIHNRRDERLVIINALHNVKGLPVIEIPKQVRLKQDSTIDFGQTKPTAYSHVTHESIMNTRRDNIKQINTGEVYREFGKAGIQFIKQEIRSTNEVVQFLNVNKNIKTPSAMIDAYDSLVWQTSGIVRDINAHNKVSDDKFMERLLLLEQFKTYVRNTRDLIVTWKPFTANPEISNLFMDYYVNELKLMLKFGDDF